MPWLLIFLPMMIVTKVPEGNGPKKHYTAVTHTIFTSRMLKRRGEKKGARNFANSCRSVWWNSRIYDHSLGQGVNTFQYCKHILKELDIKNLLTHCMEDSPWETNWVSASQEITFCGTERFIIAFTSAHYLSLSWAKSIQSMPQYPTSCRSILRLSSHLCMSLPRGLFSSGFPTKILYTSLFSPIRATFPAHLILDFITQTILGEEYRSFSSSLYSFLHCPGTSSLLGTNILLNIHKFILWLHPAFWSWDMTVYLVLSAFTSSPVSLIPTIKASAFCFIVCTLPIY